VSAIYGLVLAGGQSKRMKTDKAQLAFHGVSQVEYCARLLKPFCQDVFLSARAGQDSNNVQPIFDREPFTNAGPLGGILSAFTEYPQRSWLVLACDLPYVSAPVIEYLIHQRDPQKLATAYTSARDGLPEPLCAIYESRGHKALTDYFNSGKQCPRKFLIINADNVRQLSLQNKQALDNINTPDEYKQAMTDLSQ